MASSIPRWDGRRFAACVAAVLIAWMAMLGSRDTALGLADIRGGLGVGFDAGSWISTAYAAGDIVGVVIGCWLATALSLRRVVLGATFLFLAGSCVAALDPGLAIVLAARTVQGMAGGALLPMAIVTLLRTLPPAHRALALALYTSASTLAPQLAAGLAGGLMDRWGWSALFWANLAPGLLALGAAAYGLPREPIRVRPLLHTDRFGLLLLIAGLVMLACGFDQGNRLDWLNSAPIRALLAGGAVALCVYVAHAIGLKRDRLVDVKLLRRRNITLGAVGVVPFGVGALGCAYVIPQYLAQAHGYRPDELSTVLWDAAWPQAISYACAVVGLGRRWVGPRRLLTLGFVLVGAGLLYDSMGLDGAWIESELDPGQVLQGLGLPLILFPLLFLFVGDLRPREGLHAALLFNVMRSLGGTIGLACVATLDRVREQVRSNVLVDHIAAGAPRTLARLDALSTTVGTRSFSDGQAAATALRLLAKEVQYQAQILGHADTLAALAVVMFMGAIFSAVCMGPNASGHPGIGAR